MNNKSPRPSISENGHLNGHENGKRNRSFPAIHLENKDNLEVDDVIRIMGKTPPPPERLQRKAKPKGK